MQQFLLLKDWHNPFSLFAKFRSWEKTGDSEWEYGWREGETKYKGRLWFRREGCGWKGRLWFRREDWLEGKAVDGTNDCGLRRKAVV